MTFLVDGNVIDATEKMMIRRINTISIILIATLLAVSCTFGNTNIEQGGTIKINVREMSYSANTDFRIYETINVDPGNKTIIINNIPNNRPTFIFSSNPYASNSKEFLFLDNGVYFCSGSPSLDFKASDIGLSNGGRFAITTLEYNNTMPPFIGNESRQSLDYLSQFPVKTTNNITLYPRVYRINSSAFPDPSNVEITFELKDSSTENAAHINTTCKLFIDNGLVSPYEPSTETGKYDFSGYNNRTIYILLLLKADSTATLPWGDIVIRSGEAITENPEETIPVI